jgi:microcystin-dependent protein
MATEPFLGSLALFPFGFAPRGWAVCAGQLLPIQQNAALFSLLGTTYGGDGRTTFALPNLQGRTPVGVGNNMTLGESAGEEFHTLTFAEVPPHGHILQGTPAAAGLSVSANNLLGVTAGNFTVYNSTQNKVTLNPAAVTTAGNSQGHENRTPFLAMTWCIALVGIFPSRN